MTVAPTRNYTPTIDRLVERALKRATLMPSHASINHANYAPLARDAREHLQDVMNTLQARGVVLRHVRFHDVALTSGVATYLLPDTVIDVFGNGVHVTASSETVVQRIGREQWDKLGVRNAEGTPTLMYLHKGSSEGLELRLWPTPDAATVVRLQTHETPADSDEGQYDVDLPPYWRQYLQTAVASLLADDAGLDAKAMDLHAKAEALLPYALNKAGGRVAHQFWVGGTRR